MFDNLKLNLAEKLVSFIQKQKEKNPDIINRVATKNTFKILKYLDFKYKKLVLLDTLLETLYGLDSQILIDWHDKLNALSIDKDRKNSSC